MELLLDLPVSVAWGIRIQPTFALVGVVRGGESWDTNCPLPPAYCMLILLACSEAYEFGQNSRGGVIFPTEPMAPLRGDPE